MDARSYIIAILEDGINGVFMCPPIPGLYDMSVEELLVEWEKQRKFIRQSLDSPIIPLPPKMDGEVRKIPRFTDDCPTVSIMKMNKIDSVFLLGMSLSGIVAAFGVILLFLGLQRAGEFILFFALIDMVATLGLTTLLLLILLLGPKKNKQ